MTRFSAVTRGVLALGTGTTLLFGAAACSFETVFTTTEEDGTADRALALSAPGDANLWRTSGTGPDALNDEAEPGTQMEFVDPALLEDGELPRRMTVTEAQSLQVLQKIADMLEDKGRRIAEVATLRVYLAPDTSDPESTVDFAGWDRAYRTFFANLDPVTGDSLLTGTSAVTLTAQTSTSSATSATSEPSDGDDTDNGEDGEDGEDGATRGSAAPTTEPTDTTGDEDDRPYSGGINPTKPTVVTVGVAEQPVDGWLVQVEAEVIYESE